MRNTPCIEWKGAVDKDGYGDRKPAIPRKAHRAAWEKQFGTIPKGMCICHHCDNPPCMNVKHLFLGTPADNIQDMVRKGRYSKTGLKGADNPGAKLSEVEVRRIMFLKGKISQERLATKFGVGISAIERIHAKTHWKHLWTIERIAQLKADNEALRDERRKRRK